MASFFGTNVTTGTFQETCGSRFCEPHVLVTSIDLCSPRPEVEVLLYGPWQSTTTEHNAAIGQLARIESVWELTFISAPIEKSDDGIFLISLLEHFDGNPGSLRLMIKKAMIEALDISEGLARDARIAKLIDEIDRSVDFANGGPNFTSAVEVSLTTENITGLQANGFCRFVRSFFGYGGQYCLGIELIKAEPDLRTLLPQQDEPFAWAAA